MKPIDILTTTLQLSTGFIQYISLHALILARSITTSQSHIPCLALLLLLQVFVSLALLAKSLVYFIPWLSRHLQKTQYEHDDEGAWRGELILHVAIFMLGCAPFCGTLGLGGGVVYYTGKVWMYGRCEGNTYAMRQFRLDPSYRYSQQEGGNVVFQQPGNIRHGQREDGLVQPPAAVLAPQLTAERARWNLRTFSGIKSTWRSEKGWWKSGYYERDVRRRNFEQDVEMGIVRRG